MLQIRLMPIDTRLPSPATLFLNEPIRALLPQISEDPSDYNADEENYEALKLQQDKYLQEQ